MAGPVEAVLSVGHLERRQHIILWNWGVMCVGFHLESLAPGLQPSSCILDTREHTYSFRSCKCVSSRLRRGTATLLGPIERTNLNHWTTHVRKIQIYKRLRQDYVGRI
jgi:hypothetical protein